MNKVVLGVLCTLGSLVVGGLIYKKGRIDAGKEFNNYMDILTASMDILTVSLNTNTEES